MLLLLPQQWMEDLNIRYEIRAISLDISRSFKKVWHPLIHPSIHPLGPYSVQSIGAAQAASLAIGHNPGQVTTPTQYTSKLALILLTSEG